MNTPLLHSISQSAKLLGIGRSSLYNLIAEGKIASVKIGRRSLIRDTELKRFVRGLCEEDAVIGSRLEEREQ
jgi:excisionase family DNA binding protein